MRMRKERGFVSLELVLGLPLIVFAKLFLIGLGYALIAKQHAEAGAQYAVNVERTRQQAVTKHDADRAAGAVKEDFQLARSAGGGAIGYTASAAPREGLVSRMLRGASARAQHFGIVGTGACTPGDFLTACNPYQETK